MKLYMCFTRHDWQCIDRRTEATAKVPVKLWMLSALITELQLVLNNAVDKHLKEYPEDLLRIEFTESKFWDIR